MLRKYIFPISRPGQPPCVEHGLAPIGRPPVLPRAGLNPRYGIAAQTDSIGHQNNTLTTTTSHLASLWQFPLRGKYQGLVTPPNFICHEYSQRGLARFKISLTLDNSWAENCKDIAENVAHSPRIFGSPYFDK